MVDSNKKIPAPRSGCIQASQARFSSPRPGRRAASIHRFIIADDHRAGFGFMQENVAQFRNPPSLTGDPVLCEGAAAVAPRSIWSASFSSRARRPRWLSARVGQFQRIRLARFLVAPPAFHSGLHSDLAHQAGRQKFGRDFQCGAAFQSGWHNDATIFALRGGGKNRKLHVSKFSQETSSGSSSRV
jgi:hypothetical protein